jgi:hypothetical protein
MALSVGFIRFVSSTNATQATRFLTFPPVGLPPTEHASLSLDALWSKYSREQSEFMMDVPHARQQLGSAVGVRHRAGQSETPAPE